MTIKIKDNAPDLYFSNRYNSSFPSKSTVEMLKRVAGQVIEVDTMWLKVDEFKTVEGDRIGEKFVEEVYEDIRPYYKRCGDCGGAVKKEDERCQNCDCDYFTSLQEVNLIKQN